MTSHDVMNTTLSETLFETLFYDRVKLVNDLHFKEMIDIILCFLKNNSVNSLQC